MLRLKNIVLRKILNSGGKFATEAKVFVSRGVCGIASAPSAIIPGKREVSTTDYDIENDVNISNLFTELKNIKKITQKNVDTILNKYIDVLGSDITLSISLAYARAIATFYRKTLIEYISRETLIPSEYKSPYPLVCIFSGGVHGGCKTLQQIMISVNSNNFEESINKILNIYNDIESYVKENNKYVDLGQSSGLIVKDMTTVEKFELINKYIAKYNYDDVSIAIDVASEHLISGTKYNFDNKKYTKSEFYDLLMDYKNKYNITFIEDPFDSEDEKSWNKFRNENSDIDIVGDDLFATQAKYINNKQASTALIKMNQSGTLSNTLEAIKKCKECNVKCCISHRSYETEDTFMCDLAVSVNSEYIKIGAPRRGDRVSKYNRLLDIIKK